MIKKIRNSKGFTLVELILAVAILSILLAFSFVNVAAYMRNMKQLELDGYAKEIFIAAQNHLIMAESNGYYGRSTASGYFGTLEHIPGYTPKDTTLYYFVSPYTGTNLKDTLLYRMLPPGSIDVGNTNYIIRYDLNTGKVLDVFCTEKEDTSRYGLNNLQEKYDDLLLNYSGDEKRGLRRSYGDNKSVIGYYGGTDISIDKTDDLKAPEVTIVNGEELTATVKKDINEILSGTIEILLHIEGLQSGSIREVILYKDRNPEIRKVILYKGGNPEEGNYDYVKYDNVKKEWEIKLDNIKDSSEGHFGKLFPEFYPGEDISLQTLVFDTDKVSNRAFGNIEITNSLFGNYTEINKNNEVTASIENLRHLENLSDLVSNVHTHALSNLEVEKANQVKNINMADSGFKNGGVFEFNGDTGSTGLRPVYTGKKLEYEGNNFELKNICIDETDEDVGIFGKLESGSIVTNLQIFNPSINGNKNVGALVGKLESGLESVSKVTNIHIINPSINGNNNVGGLVGESISSELSGVYVYEKNGSSTIGSGDGTAGGLVGKMNGGSITGCFASVLVEAKNNAGGLIGVADGSSVKASYSGGHTKDGEYQTDKFNVTAEGNAGGLIGDAKNSTVEFCYSTCSASGRVAGGFVGSVSGATIKNCYCTGLVKGDTTDTSGGFSGIGNANAKTTYYKDRYLETVVYDYDKQIKEEGGKDVEGIRSMDPDTVNITDWDKEYADFTDYKKADASDAEPYDKKLIEYYNNKYPFKTIDGNDGYKIYTADQEDQADQPALPALPNTDPDMMKKHYGDWPIAETIVINNV
ncbi:type II secretion system protein [Oribacterium sp. NK2B42]|uniref:type II secretion system protein n=1 Tax=Oribacterium sp. NK2B42 TaxID=689781 RepID=UPI000492AC95|nr:type II secretion system protein [Oribacterium sp. NK2B42]